MQKINLQLIFKIVIALLVLLFVLLIFSGGKKNNNIIKISKELVGQGSSTLQYGDVEYSIDKNSNSIVAHDTKTDDLFEIAKTSKNIKNKLYIINNNLIFALDNITYYIPLDDETYSIKKLMDGEVAYINDDVIVYINRNDDLNKLYIGSYDKASFRATTTVYYELAQGYNIEFIKKLDNKLYFTSINSDKSASLFTVDIKVNEVAFVAKQKLPNLDNVVANKIVDVEIDKDNLYYVQVVTTKDDLTITKNTKTVWKVDASHRKDEIVSGDTL